MKRTIITYLVSILVATGLVLLVCGINGVLTTEMPKQTVVRYVCDGFFVSAVLLLAAGAMSWASRQGTFDGLGYYFSIWKERFTNHKRDWHKKEDYSEYKERKAEKKKDKKINHYFIIGGILMVVAVILLVVYHFGF